MTSQPRAVSLPATRRPLVPSNISLVVARARCHELQLRTVAGQACRPQIHTSRGWGTVRCSEVLPFLSPQTSSCLSWAKLSNTHDLQLQIPKVDASCLHKCLGMTSRLSSFLDTMNGCISFFDKVQPKDNLLSWFNPIEQSVASTSV
jgi:hypothetical protein